MRIRGTHIIGRWVSRSRFLIVFLLVVSIGIGSSAKYALAGTESALGWLWGGAEMLDVNGVTPPNNGVMDGDENGLGWVSMNNRDCDPNNDAVVDASEHTANPACPAGGIARYGVDIPMTDGDLSGYAWSEHYGWISFNASDVVGCDSVSVPGPCNPRRDGDNIRGWARIISICDTGNAGNAHTRDGHCDAGDDGWNTGGWSGWIDLSSLLVSRMDKSGTTPTYAYSDELGWIDFSFAGFGGSLKICPNSCTGGADPYNTLSSFSNFPVTLYACYGTGACTGGDVNVSGAWTEANPIPDVVSLSTSSGFSTGVSRTYVGTTSADEVITLTYTPPSGTLQSVTATARASCISDYTTLCAAQSNRCSTEVISITDRCGDTTNTCRGARSCNFNFKESSP